MIIVCELCGDTLPIHESAGVHCKLGKYEIEEYHYVDALYVHCERCLTQQEEDNDDETK